VTAGNSHNIQPVRELAKSLTDKLYGDKGYLSKALEAVLLDKGEVHYNRSQKYESKSHVVTGPGHAFNYLQIMKRNCLVLLLALDC
jgi:hypothetical protein